jgi:hypothetical protein
MKTIKHHNQTPSNNHRAKTHCSEGHPFDEANTYVNPMTGARSCRTCRSRRVVEFRERLASRNDSSRSMFR